ncbi:hypothetical protein [Beijerinckia sp. L45]|uniref:hypothetical protein n=1 Tax=Beijerinckia sp. L45 TaxID=1641855 RepID=UPI0034CDCA55
MPWIEFVGWLVSSPFRALLPLARLEQAGVVSIADVYSLHVATYVQDLGRHQTTPSTKLSLATIRMMFNWLATGGVLTFNPGLGRTWLRPCIRHQRSSVFRTIARGTGQLSKNALNQRDAYAMVTRQAEAVGIKTKIGNDTFRATGVTAYLKNGGTLEKAALMANHSSTRTTQLYDCRRDDVTLDKV